jgi:hypothetical protein
MMAMSTYQVGVASVDVTPPVGTFLAGYAARDAPSEGVYHPLRAVCVAIDDGGEPVLLVSIEWLGFYDRTEAARARIGARTGLPPERVLLTGTHTHCGPVLRQQMDARRHGVLDEDFIARALDDLAASAARALDDRQPSRLRAGTGWCGISSSRRRPDGKGGVVFKASLDAPHDHQVSVLAVETEDSALRHVLFSYACHPTSTGPLLEIGGDYPTFACDYVERAHPGAVACFFQGCAGDQKVDARDENGDAYRRLELHEVKERGERLGEAVERVLAADDLTPVEGGISVAQELVTLTTEAAPAEELRAHLEAPQAYVRDWARHHLALLEAGTPAESQFRFEVQTLRFGDSLAVIGLAGEMSVEFALRYRQQFGERFRHVWSLGYANEMIGYVPVRRQYPEAGYEVVDNNRHLLYTGPFTPDSEDRIAAAVVRSLGGES